MALVKLAPVAVFLISASMFSMDTARAVGCSGVCSPFQIPPCGSSDCRCIPAGLVVGFCTHPSLPSVAKMVEEHPNLCQSDSDCSKKGSGSFCARFPNAYIDYGWCFDSTAKAKDFLKMPAAIAN